MSDQHQLGRLLAYAEKQDARLDRIETKLDQKVDIALFERGIAEHKDIRRDLKALEVQYAEGTTWRKIGDRVLFVVVGVLCASILKLVGIV